MSDKLPAYREFTQEELCKLAKEYVVAACGKPIDSPNVDRWHERYGLLLDFVTGLFEEKEP